MSVKKRDAINDEVMDSFLKDYPFTKKVIEEFLSLYDVDTAIQYRSGIKDLLINELEKLDVTKLTINDYKTHIPEYKSNTKEYAKNGFFEYLYTMDYLTNPEGFEDVMHKPTLKKRFTKDKKRKPKKVENNDANLPLTVEELISIQNIVQKDSSKLDTLKMQFCWYAIFELGVDVSELRKKITGENFKHGQLITSDAVYDIPNKFKFMFSELKNREYHNGFRTLDLLLKNLGEDAKLERKLIPRIIKIARKEYMIKCGNCFNTYPNITTEWESVNNRIVCLKCAEELKKKLDLPLNSNSLDNTDIEIPEDNESLSVLYTFNDLKKQIEDSPIDYLKLHEIQIKLGELGEAYVYEHECEKLKDSKYLHNIDERKALEPSNGYDILSYTLEGKPLHIEVKATAGTEDTFYLSYNEYQTAKRMKEEGLTYIVYFVKEVMSDSPTLIKVEDITENEQYSFEEMNWKVSKVNSD